MKKKVWALTLAICMVVSMLPAEAAGAELQGAGTQAEPYVITTEEELKAVSGDGWYVLGKDIALTDWSSIGDFSGHLSGKNADSAYTISGLTAPLFTKLTGATVENLTLEANIDTGTEDTAALAVDTEGNTVISGVTVKGAVTGGGAAGLVKKVTGTITIDGCVNEATVTGNDRKAAGFICSAGAATSVTITDSVNNGNISAAQTAENPASYEVYAAGFIAWNGYTDLVTVLENCTNNGSITGTRTIGKEEAGGTSNGSTVAAGGIIGTCWNGDTATTLTNVTNNGTVLSVNKASTHNVHAGGIVGMCNPNSATTFNNVTSNGPVTGKISNDSNTAGVANVGGIVGQLNTATVIAEDVTVTSDAVLTGTSNTSTNNIGAVVGNSANQKNDVIQIVKADVADTSLPLVGTGNGSNDESYTVVAQIGDTYYTTLQDAINTAATNDVITLITDTTENVTVEPGGSPKKNLYFELGGYTLTGSITNEGQNFRINEKSGDQTGKITGNITCVKTTGESPYTYIYGGTIEGTITAGTEAGSSGTVNIYGGHFSGALVKESGGTLHTNGGYYKADPTAYLQTGYIVETLTADEHGCTYRVVEDKAAKIVRDGQDVYYRTLNAAITGAKAGETVILLQDLSGSSAYAIEKSITLDLNNHTVTGTSSSFVFKANKYSYTDIPNIDVTIKNGTINHQPASTSNSTAGAVFATQRVNLTLEDVTITAEGGENYGYGVRVGEDSSTRPTVTIKSGTSISASTAGVVVIGKSDSTTTTLIVEDGTISGGYYGISGNGLWDNTSITVNGGKITGTTAALYHPQDGDLTINGGTLNGPQGVQFCGAGNLTVTGGTITATSDALGSEPTVPSGDGCIADGAAISIVSRGGGYGDASSATVSITGGTIQSENNVAIREYGAESAESLVKDMTINEADGQLVVIGGTDKAAVQLDKLTENKVITGGNFSSNVSAYVPSMFLVNNTGNVDGAPFVLGGNTSVFAGGKGTASDPFQIATVEQLKAFRDSVNDGNDYAGLYIQLTADITLDGTSWSPIGKGTRDGSGYTGNAFKGTFDGNGKTIDGLTISGTTNNEDDALGLFGVVDGGTVKNLNLTGVSINSENGECVGGAIGLMVGGATADSITVSGTVSAVRGNGGIVGRMTIEGTISNCTNQAAVSATGGANVGGIVGTAYYTAEGKEMSITNCTNTGTVSGTTGVGGVVGLSAANVSDCTNSAAITGNGTSVGGIVGEQQNYGQVTGNTNSGAISNQDSSGYGTGGIVGWMRYNGTAAAYPNKEIIQVTGNTNSGSVTGGNDGGGIVGTVYNAGVVTGNTNTAEAISGTTFAAGIVGNLQYTETPVGDIPQKNITVTNNVSATTNISGQNTDPYTYNNDSGNQGKLTENSAAWAAQIGETKYATLQGAFSAAAESEGSVTIQLLEGTFGPADGSIEEIKLPATLKNVTVKGAEGDQTTLRNIKIMAADGTALDYENITFDGIVFENSNVVISGWRTGNVVMKNWTFTNNTFKNIVRDGTNEAAVHFNLGTGEALENFTFSGNDIDGVSGGSNSGVCVNAAAGTILVEKNTIKNVAWNAVQITNVAEGSTYTLTGNTFEACGADEGIVNLYNNQAEIKINENKFIAKDENQPYLCYISADVDAQKNFWGVPDGDGVKFDEAFAEKMGHSDGDTSQVKADVYYKAEAMRDPEDLNTYVPSSGGSSGSTTYAITVSQAENGSVSASAKSASRGRTVTVTVKADEGYELESLTVTDAKGNEVKLTDKGNGKYTFTMPASRVEIKASFTKEEHRCASEGFTDVDVEQWYHEAIDYVVDQGMMKGVEQDVFAPGSDLTRGMLAQVLYNLEGTPDIRKPSPYTDVAQDAWYTDAVTWAADKGIVTGYGEGLFGPEDPVTREQMAAILYRYAVLKGYDMTAAGSLNGFEDGADVSSWAEKAMEWAVGIKLLSGKGDGILDPTGTATRAEVAQILMNFCQNVAQ